MISTTVEIISNYNSQFLIPNFSRFLSGIEDPRFCEAKSGQFPMNPKALKPKTYNLNPNSGFTLIETLLVILLFSVIMILMGGVFVSSLDLQRRAFNIQQAEENAGFILESMAKEIRVSQIAGPDTSCPTSPAATLSITHPVNGAITYSLSGNAVHRNANGADSIISSNTVQFTRLQFCISGTPIDNQQQPRVTIIGSVRSVKTKQQATIDFQTTLSQRFLSN